MGRRRRSCLQPYFVWLGCVALWAQGTTGQPQPPPPKTLRSQPPPQQVRPAVEGGFAAPEYRDEGPTCAVLDSTPIAALDGRRSQEEINALSPFAGTAVEMDSVPVPTCVLVPVDKYPRPVEQNQGFEAYHSSYKDVQCLQKHISLPDYRPETLPRVFII
ncbi:hypothetical protein U0070_009352 [Myodes glareolus]|uniref:Uncharacterized protein n=1 Tax=Myodes glareolus TaxID=447135 RepID=A0AAW0I7B5_MYOGA